MSEAASTAPYTFTLILSLFSLRVLKTRRIIYTVTLEYLIYGTQQSQLRLMVAVTRLGPLLNHFLMHDACIYVI